MPRNFFPVAVSGGTAYSATTPPIHGDIRQMRWSHATDTGQIATMTLSLLPDADDTGIGFQIYNSGSVNQATQFTKAPRQPTHDLNGDADVTDTGTPADPSPYFCAGDHVKLVVTPADTGVVIDGKFYLWSSNA